MSLTWEWMDVPYYKDSFEAPSMSRYKEQSSSTVKSSLKQTIISAMINSEHEDMMRREFEKLSLNDNNPSSVQTFPEQDEICNQMDKLSLGQTSKPRLIFCSHCVSCDKCGALTTQYFKELKPLPCSECRIHKAVKNTMAVVKYPGKDYPIDDGMGPALTLNPEDITSEDYTKMDDLDDRTHSRTHDDGWTIEGKIENDYYYWVNDFTASHPEHGYVKGNFEVKVEASSEAAFAHFYEHHPPNSWDYADI